MSVEFRLTRGEYFAAQTLYARRQFRRVLWVALPAFLGLVLWLERDRLGDPGIDWLMIAIVAAVAIGVGLVILALLWWLLPLVQAAIMVLTVWPRQPSLAYPISFRIDNDGIHWQSDHGNWRHRWDDMIRRAENDRICLLYLAPNLMVPLPRRVLTEADRALIRAKLRK